MRVVVKPGGAFILIAMLAMLVAVIVSRSRPVTDAATTKAQVATPKLSTATATPVSIETLKPATSDPALGIMTAQQDALPGQKNR